MIKKDLIERSVVRTLEKALHGGLKEGEVGVIASKKGSGKTSMLVQLGLDQLLQGKSVVHISFSQHVDYALQWYTDMFTELAEKKNLDKPDEIRESMASHRIILNFNQEMVKTDQIIKTINALSEGGSKPSVLVIDDFDFTKASPEAVQKMKQFAKEMGLVIWYTAKEDIKQSEIAPALQRYEKDIDILLYLGTEGSLVSVDVLKEHERGAYKTGLHIDTKTLFLLEK